MVLQKTLAKTAVLSCGGAALNGLGYGTSASRGMCIRVRMILILFRSTWKMVYVAVGWQCLIQRQIVDGRQRQIRADFSINIRYIARWVSSLYYMKPARNFRGSSNLTLYN